MSIIFKRAVRENVPLLIGLVGGTGAGKTFTAMRLASGMSDGKPFAVIDTENGRARHYSDEFVFDCGDLHAPFKPTNYLDAIKAADVAGYPVIVVDSASHMWSGDGGVLDWQEAELDRMAGDDWKKREAVKMAAWIKPKLNQKSFTNGLLQIRAHVIMCFRAEMKIEMVKENGKTVIHAKQSLTGLDGWIPICDKNLPFELTTSLLFTADRPGIPQPIKLQEKHKALFPLNQQVNEESGKRIVEWARGGTSKQKNSATLKDVIAAIESASTPDEMTASKNLVMTLCDDDKKIAGDAYKAKLSALKKKPESVNTETGEITSYAKLADMIKNALDADLLDAHATLISSVSDEAQQVELHNLYVSKRATLD
jgi:hypothetical protein